MGRVELSQATTAGSPIEYLAARVGGACPASDKAGETKRLTIKTVSRPKARALVFAAVNDVNQQLRRGKRLVQSETTVISGEGSQLDSLGFVNLMFAIEQKVEEEFGVTLTLVDDVADVGEQDPFRTLGSLSDYVLSTLVKKLNA